MYEQKNLNVTYDVLEGLENLDLLTNLSKKLRMSDEPARKLLIKELQAADQETIRQIIYPQILKLIPHSEELIGANPFLDSILTLYCSREGQLFIAEKLRTYQAWLYC